MRKRTNEWNGYYLKINQCCLCKGYDIMRLKRHQTCPSPPLWIYMVAKKCLLTPLAWNTCSCFSVLQRMLLRSIISENFKACQKHSPSGVSSSFRMYLYFPNGQEEALTGIEVMLMQCGTSFRCNSVYSTKIQPLLNTINLLQAWFYINFNFP